MPHNEKTALSDSMGQSGARLHDDALEAILELSQGYIAGGMKCQGQLID